MQLVLSIFGAIFILLGWGYYLASGMLAFSAALPAAFGWFLVLCAAVARVPGPRPWAWRSAAIVGGLALLWFAPSLLYLRWSYSQNSVYSGVLAIRSHGWGCLLALGFLGAWAWAWRAEANRPPEEVFEDPLGQEQMRSRAAARRPIRK